MIIVTGANGELGSQIIHHLLRRVPSDAVGVSVRNPARAAELASLGVRVRQADFAEPETLHSAFEGARQVLVVSAGGTGAADNPHGPVIDAAIAAGAERVLYTSHQAAADESFFAPMPNHIATERYLAQTGTAYTALRNGFYANFVPRLIGQALETGEIVAPADGPVSWTTHPDLAEAAATILAEPGRFEGPTPPLTAADSLDLEDIAGILSELTGRTIRRTVADDDEFTAGLLSRGVPEGSVTMLLGMFLASRSGEFAATDRTLADVLGRPAMSLGHYLTQTVASD